MSWSALVGAFIGAGIPTILGYIKALNARRMADAEAFGPALLLLDRMDPIRVTMNVGSREVERARWEELSKRVDAACERLLVISAGHPRRVVRELARQAQRKLSNVRQASSWAVSDLLQNRDNPEWMGKARQDHEQARQALHELVEANFRRRVSRCAPVAGKPGRLAALRRPRMQ
jgi:hypothetical protein